MEKKKHNSITTEKLKQSLKTQQKKKKKTLQPKENKNSA